MINLDREITPEDFTPGPEPEDFLDGYPANEERYRQKQRERAELKRLYEIQEANKAAAKAKADYDRKALIAYSIQLAREICGRISEGEVLYKICQDPSMPTYRNVNSWLKEHREFKSMHDEAVNDRTGVFADQLITISDDAENDIIEVKKGNKIVKMVDQEAISRAKLRIDARKAHLKAYAPQRWSETSTLNVNSVDKTDDMNLEELEKLIANLMEKDRIINEEPPCYPSEVA